MHNLNFLIIFLSIITLIDILFNIKRPIQLKISFLIVISCLFLINSFIYISKPNTYLLIIALFVQMVGWSTGNIIGNKLFKTTLCKLHWYLLVFDFLLFLIFVGFILYNPSILSFSNDSLLSFHISDNYWLLKLDIILFESIMLFLVFRLLYLNRNQMNIKNIYKDELNNWAIKLYYPFIIYTICFLLFIFFNKYSFFSHLFQIADFTLSLMVLLSIIYKPKVLTLQGFSYNKLSAFDKSGFMTLNDDNFTIPFFTNYYYLQKDANIDKFCKLNNIDDKEEFYDLIIIKFNMSFNSLINKHRVEYFMSLVQSNKYTNYSIDALAQESGFNSRHHLYKPFKKFHGGTPSDFIYFATN